MMFHGLIRETEGLRWIRWLIIENGNRGNRIRLSVDRPEPFPSTIMHFPYIMSCSAFLLCTKVTAVSLPDILFKQVVLFFTKSIFYVLKNAKLFQQLCPYNGLQCITMDYSVKNIRIIEYIRIFSATNVRLYHIRIIFLIRIYSDIHSYHFFYTNIFGYSFVSFFYANIFGY